MYLDRSGLLCSVISADINLSHGLDRAPDADKARFHHEAVAAAVSLRLTILFINFDDTRDDVAKLVGGALDGMGLAGRCFPDRRLVPSPLSKRPAPSS
jgi:hypothetical protein